jgi:hypothetical protein
MQNLRRTIRKILLESQSVITPEQEAKIIDYMKSPGGFQSALQLADTLDPTWIQRSFTRPEVMKAFWDGACASNGLWGNYSFNKWSGKLDFDLSVHPIKKNHQRNGDFDVDAQTLEITWRGSSFSEYVAYPDGDTDWEGYVPHGDDEMARKYNGQVLTPEIAQEIARDFKAMSDAEPL